MIITVLSAVKTPSISKAGKPYTYLELAYKGEDGKVTGKKVMPFGEGKAVFEVLQAATNGEAYNIHSVKNEVSGYWDWTGAKKSDGTVTSTTTTSAASTETTRQPAGKVTGSNYETSEERAKRQVYIVRQSSVTAALSFHGGKAKSTDEVIDTAKKFEAFVFNTGEVEKPVAIPKIVSDDIADMESDVPY